jgi:hypothetical protein
MPCSVFLKTLDELAALAATSRYFASKDLVGFTKAWPMRPVHTMVGCNEPWFRIAW